MEEFISLSQGWKGWGMITQFSFFVSGGPPATESIVEDNILKYIIL